jgi:cation diffusion facilitator family transporter
MRVLWISLAVLGATALVQAVITVASGSVALLGDTLHNAADALTAVPLGIAFLAARRPASRRYTYGYGRAEDLAGVVIVVIIAASAVLAAVEAISRLLHPRPVSGLIAVAVAALLGFASNEVVARYRIRAGRAIGSAALVADGLHARADGFASLAVLAAAGGAALGWNWADPVVGCGPSARSSWIPPPARWPPTRSRPAPSTTCCTPSPTWPAPRCTPTPSRPPGPTTTRSSPPTADRPA